MEQEEQGVSALSEGSSWLKQFFSGSASLQSTVKKMQNLIGKRENKPKVEIALNMMIH